MKLNSRSHNVNVYNNLKSLTNIRIILSVVIVPNYQYISLVTIEFSE